VRGRVPPGGGGGANLGTAAWGNLRSGARVSSLGAQGSPGATSGGTIKLLRTTAPATLGYATLEAGRIAAPGVTLPSGVVGWVGNW